MSLLSFKEIIDFRTKGLNEVYRPNIRDELSPVEELKEKLNLIEKPGDHIAETTYKPSSPDVYMKLLNLI